MKTGDYFIVKNVVRIAESVSGFSVTDQFGTVHVIDQIQRLPFRYNKIHIKGGMISTTRKVGAKQVKLLAFLTAKKAYAQFGFVSNMLPNMESARKWLEWQYVSALWEEYEALAL